MLQEQKRKNTSRRSVIRSGPGFSLRLYDGDMVTGVRDKDRGYGVVYVFKAFSADVDKALVA